MKRIETQVDLPAMPSAVWEQLVDTEAMGSWNPFITYLSGVLAVGERLKVRIAPVGGRPMTFTPRVTVVEPGQRLEWLGTLGIPGLFDGRHSFTLTPVGHGHTRLVQAENFTGALVPLARSVLAKTEAGFEAMNAALRARLEKDQNGSLEKDQTGPKDLPAH
jgi:hypothetical protein